MYQLSSCDTIFPEEVKTLRELITRKSTDVLAPSPTVITPDEAWALRRKSRGERRRELKQSKNLALATSARVCWRCGFGALPRIANSNLVRMKDNEGNEVFGHASPLVCAGSVRAVTSQARENVGEALSDFLRVTQMRVEGYLRLWVSSLKANLIRFFTTEDPSVNRGGPSASQKTRRAVQ